MVRSMLNSKLFLILVSIDLETFSILPPYVLGSRNIPVPMPTTLIGALLYPVMKDKYGDHELDFDEIYKEAQGLGIRYVTFRAAPYLSITTLERATSITYQRRLMKMNMEVIKECIDVFTEIENYGLKTVEEKYGSKNKCIEQYKEVILNTFAISSRGITVFSGTSYIAYIVNNENLAKYAWQIVRIGRKEDLVVVRDVKVLDLNELKPLDISAFNTRFYVPKNIVREVSYASLWRMMNYLNGDIRDDDIYVPRGLFNAHVVIDPDKSIVYEVSIDGMREFVIIPREVVRNA